LARREPRYILDIRYSCFGTLISVERVIHDHDGLHDFGFTKPFTSTGAKHGRKFKIKICFG